MTDVQQKDTMQEAPSPTAPKRKAPDSTPGTINFTSRNPPWTYLKLQLIPQPDSPLLQPLDPLSARTYLSSALSQFLGVTGTAIPIDILKIENKGSTSSKPNGVNKYDCVWVRVPRDDGAAVVAAISSWIGGSGSDNGAAWRVCAKGNFLGALVSGSGSDLFDP
ncbi:uncharacterized protein N7473_003432 [Penicillium subrubescens]|uniref:Ribonucleases P/MRP subunit Pop8-like domain-containing protein n=1 Tax=Penicillium subrubescens TaxID=1316194 RepID=A0A1Q5TI80_9EURO|nr:uncharacterized protein N7473_003432 [Penicillium subrubescens]KAJ5906516.1 hypothetical protein N7473_003432 [Penicillium subrubescens]OKO99919.1 hypothetical protein PENSUB_8136 [Penicillium subrubescens]